MDSGVIRVVIDTNIWISFLIGKKLSVLLQLLDRKDIEVVSTAILKEECLRVAKRPKFKRYFPPQAIEELDEWMELHTQMVELGEIPKRCRDPKDDFLLELAIRAQAVYLVSGDDDLLALGEIEGCRIMTLTQFIEELH